MRNHLCGAGARAACARAVISFVHLVSAGTALVLTGCEGGTSDSPPEEQRAPARETAKISEALRTGDDCMQLRRGLLAELAAGRSDRAKGCRTDSDCELSTESPSCQSACPTAVLKARRGEAIAERRSLEDRHCHDDRLRFCGVTHACAASSGVSCVRGACEVVVKGLLGATP